MLPKLSTYSAALELRTFDVRELASRAGVELPTAQTVVTRLRRSHPDALTPVRLRTGARGQPPLRFTLTEQGRQYLLEEVRRWGGISSFAVEDPKPLRPVAVTEAHAESLRASAYDEAMLPTRSADAVGSVRPTGLAAARRAIDELLTSESDPANLVGHIRQNLRWARNRLSEKPDAALERECDVLDGQLSTWLNRSSTREDASVVANAQAAVDDIENVAAIEVIPLGADIGAAEVAERTRVVVADLMKALEKLTEVTNDVDYRCVADVHYWMAPDCHSPKDELKVQFFCVDSSDHPDRVRKNLLRWWSKPFAGQRVLLDKSHYALLEQLARMQGTDYFADCTTQLDWFPRVAAAAQQWLRRLHAIYAKSPATHAHAAVVASAGGVGGGLGARVIKVMALEEQKKSDFI